MQEGASAGEAAKRFGVCKRTAERYWKRFRQTGQCLALRRGGRRVSKLRAHLSTISGWIEARNDLTLEELLARLRGELGVEIKAHALWHQLNHLGLTYKRNASRRRARQARCESRPGALAGEPALAARGKACVH
jgi:transposase